MFRWLDDVNFKLLVRSHDSRQSENSSESQMMWFTSSNVCSIVFKLNSKHFWYENFHLIWISRETRARDHKSRCISKMSLLETRNIDPTIIFNFALKCTCKKCPWFIITFTFTLLLKASIPNSIIEIESMQIVFYFIGIFQYFLTTRFNRMNNWKNFDVFFKKLGHSGYSHYCVYVKIVFFISFDSIKGDILITYLVRVALNRFSIEIPANYGNHSTSVLKMSTLNSICCLTFENSVDALGMKSNVNDRNENAICK